MRDLIGSPFYSSFHSLLTSSFSLVVSFNGATSLILGYEFCSQGCHEFLVISICLRPCSCSHSSLTRPHASRLSRSPLGPHFRDYSPLALLRLFVVANPKLGYRATWPNTSPAAFCLPPRSRSSYAPSCPHSVVDRFAALRHCVVVPPKLPPPTRNAPPDCLVG